MRFSRTSICTLAVVLVGLAAAAPQSGTVFSSLGIDLWPDYDRPGVLVIYRATVAPGVTLPAELKFRIPAAAGAPTAVAEKQSDGELITLAYERTVDSGTALIEVTATRPIVQLEYYDPGISREGDRRSFVFTWPGDYEVGDFSVSVQQPHLAQGFTMEPDATSAAPSVDGLTYHTVSRAGLDAGETLDIRVAYEKASEQLSIETMAPVASPESSAPASEATSAENTTVVIVVATILVFAAVAAGLLLIRSRGAADFTTPAGAPAAPSMPSGRAPARFCTQCGVGADAADRFCHRCGSELNA